MAKRKKGKELTRDFRKALAPPIGLGLISFGTGAIAGPTGVLLPVGTVNPLTQLSVSSAQFAGLTGTIGLTGLALKQLKGLEPKRKRRLKKYGEERIFTK